MARARWARLLLTAAAAAAAGCAQDAASGATGFGAAAASGSAVDTLISTASATIGGVSDLLVARDGSVYVSDPVNSEVHVVPDSGGPVRTIGRKGSGPGELNRPSGLVWLDDTLAVVDYGNNRIELLDAAGAAIGTRPLPGGYSPAVSRSGWIVRARLTMDSTLASIHDPSLEVRARIGTIVGAPSNVVSMGRMREEIARGEVPQILLNTAEAVWAPDESVWLLVPARGTVERFERAGGAPRWSVTLADSAFPAVKREAMRRTAASPRAIYPLKYTLDADAVGDRLWILLGQSAFGPAVIQILEPDGTLGLRLTFEAVRGVDHLAVDAARHRIYFSTLESAELLRARLPDAP